MLTEDLLLTTDLTTDKASQKDLRESASWGKFLGIVGYVFSGIVAAAAIIGSVTLARVYSNHQNYNRTGSLIEGGTLVFLYLAGAAVIFCMSLFLYRFSKKATKAVNTNDQQEFAASLKNLKLYFRFAGIVSIIILLIAILATISIMMASSFGR